MKITGHPTFVRYNGNYTAQSTCRQCDWVGVERSNFSEARQDGREHTLGVHLVVVGVRA